MADGGPAALYTPWAAGFEKHYPGLTVQVRGAFSNQLVADIDRQLESGAPAVDVAILQTLQDFARWKAAGALLKTDIPAAEHLAPDIRAKIVLLAIEGLEKTVIAARPGVAMGVVSRRRKRFAEEGMTGLAGRSAAAGRASYHPVMKTSGITAALPAQDLGRAKAFYVEKVGLQALESGFLKARDGQVGLTVGDGVSQLFVYPARARSSGEFTQAVIHVTDVRAAVEEMRGRGVAFEEYDTPETRTENGVARMPGGGEAAWFKDSEGNLVGVVPA